MQIDTYLVFHTIDRRKKSILFLWRYIRQKNSVLIISKFKQSTLFRVYCNCVERCADWEVEESIIYYREYSQYCYKVRLI